MSVTTDPNRPSAIFCEALPKFDRGNFLDFLGYHEAFLYGIFQGGGWMTDCGYVREYESVLDNLKSYKFHPATKLLISVQNNDNH